MAGECSTHGEYNFVKASGAPGMDFSKHLVYNPLCCQNTTDTKPPLEERRYFCAAACIWAGNTWGAVFLSLPSPAWGGMSEDTV